MSSLSFGMITCADWQLNVVYHHLHAYTPIKSDMCKVIPKFFPNSH